MIRRRTTTEGDSCSTLSECLAQRDNYEAVFNSMNEGLVIVNAEQAVTMCNASFYSITGLAPEDVLSRNIKEVFCKNQTCGINQAFLKTISTGKPCRDEEMDIPLGSGKRLPAVFSTAILKNAAGRVTGIVVVFRDVSKVQELEKKLHERYRFHQLIGKNERMQDIYDLIEDLADTDAYVLIQGESGTGKELVANAIHYQSRRSGGPFVKVSCAALSETLLESELFGHVKGAYTGAFRDKPGRFELADGGTIFLDEIGEIGPAVQVKLLRVLQEKEFERVGDIRTRKVNVRVIAATNKDLQQLIRESRFREDLYYRLKVITITIPPLRERREDIPLLVEHFIKKFNAAGTKHITGIGPEALNLLMEAPWQGNVRELEHAIEHAFVKARSAVLAPKDLPFELQSLPRSHGRAAEEHPGHADDKDALIDALGRSGWNISKTARLLDINRVTVWRRMKKYGLTATSP